MNQLAGEDMSDRREFPRTPMHARVLVMHPTVGERIFPTRDVSDGGLYVVVEDGFFPPLGTVVEVQVQGLPVPAPILKMQVVRKGRDGFGLQFID